MTDIATKLLEAAPLWVHVIDAFFVLCGVAALAAALLPKSNKPWRKVLDFLAANFGNARNLYSVAHGKTPSTPAPSAPLSRRVRQRKPAIAATSTKEEPAAEKAHSVLDERL